MISHIQRQTRSHNEMVGWHNHDKNQSPYLLGEWCTVWRTIIPKKFLHYCEGSEPHVRLPNLGIWQRDWESGFEDQWDLIIGLPENWRKQRLQSWRAQAKFCMHQDPEKRSSNPTGDWIKTTCYCWRDSCGGMGWQGLTIGRGVLELPPWHKLFWS